MGKSTYHHGNLREALLQAAREVLIEHGIDGLSLRKVAALAGVSATAPYSHFRDKQALLGELAAEGFDELADAMERGAQEQEQPERDRLVGLAQGYVAFATGNPALFQLMFGPAIGEVPASSSLATASARAYQLMESSVAEQISEPQDARQLGVAAAGAWSMVHGLSTLLNDGRLQAGKGALPQQPRLVEVLCQLLRFG